MPKCNCKVTLLKLHFGMSVVLYIYCIFSEHLFLIPKNTSGWLLLVVFTEIFKTPKELISTIMFKHYFSQLILDRNNPNNYISTVK